MVNYYFDIETYGEKHKSPYDYRIITIQYQQIWQDSGKPIKGESLKILKSWESSEEQIIREFLDIFKIEEVFNFIPIGFNLRYEFIVLSKRAKKYNIELDLEQLLRSPFVDIRSILVILNKGFFKGSGLDKFTGKESSGKIILDYYIKKEYEKIEEYIRIETDAFLHLYQWIIKEFPESYKRNYKIPKIA